MNAIAESLKKRREDMEVVARQGNPFVLRGLSRMARALDAGGFALASDQTVLQGEPDEKKMTATFIVTALSQDRQGDIVVPEGCRKHLDSYRANPVVSLNHLTYGTELPIATAGPPEGPLSWNVLPDKITSTAHFHGKTELSEQVFELVTLKVMRGASLGFIPHLGEQIPFEEPPNPGRNEVLFDYPGYKFLEWEVVEWGIVFVPCNRSTVSMILGKGRLAGRPIAAPLVKDLEPFRLPRRLWPVQREVNFDESEHPRAEDGRFGSKPGEHTTEGGKDSGTSRTPEKAVEVAQGIVADFKARMDALTNVPLVKQVKGLLAKIKAGTEKLHEALKSRYGPKTALLIMASGQAAGWSLSGIGALTGTVIYVPGSTVIGALPAMAVAETILQARKLFKSEGEDVDLSEKELEEAGEAFRDEVLKLAESEVAGQQEELQRLLQAAADEEDQQEKLAHSRFVRVKAMLDAPSLSDFDISEQELRPATVVYDFVARHLDCEIKEVYESGVSVPSAKLGGFLSSWKEETGDFRQVDVRNINSGGTESPPRYEVIRLNSDKTRDFLVDGLVFLDGRFRCVAELSKTWYGLQLTLYTRQQERRQGLELIDRTWEAARTRHNYLKGEAFSLSGEFLPKTSETWADVFLPEKISEQLARTIKLINSKGRLFANRGSIFLGPPGTGKTLSARVIRNEVKATFVWISAADFHRSGAFGGFSYAFELAKELAPAVLVFEDVDHWMDSWTVDLVKTEMDGIGRHAGVWTILTTNFPEHLPEALIDRPGRFHDVLYFGLPDQTIRKAMIEKWLPELDGIALAEAVNGTDGYSGAHVYELCHFARVLHDEESKSYPDAVQAALEKVREQRRLIVSTGVGVRRRALPAQIAKYVKGRTRPLVKADASGHEHKPAGQGGGQFTSGGGGGGGKEEEADASTIPVDDPVHSYVEAFRGEPVDLDNLNSATEANDELESDGSNYRIVPGEGGWHVAAVEDLEDEYGADWKIGMDPLTGKPEVGPTEWFSERESLAGDKPFQSYGPAFNANPADVSAEELHEANSELESDGSEFRLHYDDEQGLWVAQPEDEYDPEDEEERLAGRGEKSTGRLYRKEGGRMIKKWVPPSRRVKQDGAQQPSQQGQQQPGQREQGTGEEAVQAILCPKSVYPTPEEAASYVQQEGLDASDVEDVGDAWAFIQFEPGECSAESARREARSDGSEVVFCVRAGDEQQGEPPARVAPDGGNGESKTMKGKGNTFGACPTCKSKDAVPVTGTLALIQWLRGFLPTRVKDALEECVSAKIPKIAEDHPEMSEEQRTAVAYSMCGEDKKSLVRIKALGEGSGQGGGYLQQEKPPAQNGNGQDGKEGDSKEKKLKAGQVYIKACKDCMEEHGPMQDHPVVQKWHDKTYGSLKKAAGEAYPEHDFGFPKGDDERSEEESGQDGDRDGKDGKDDNGDEKKGLEQFQSALTRLSERLDGGAKELFRVTGRKV